MSKLRPYLPALLYILADTLCIGAGMGIPIFAILLGFVAGWLLPRWSPGPRTMQGLFGAALLAAGYTLLLLLAIWGPPLAMLWDPGADLADFGVPLILYTPRASFIGWEVLMIVISPVLQLMAIVSAMYVRLMRDA